MFESVLRGCGEGTATVVPVCHVGSFLPAVASLCHRSSPMFVTACFVVPKFVMGMFVDQMFVFSMSFVPMFFCSKCLFLQFFVPKCLTVPSSLWSPLYVTALYSTLGRKTGLNYNY